MAMAAQSKETDCSKKSKETEDIDIDKLTKLIAVNAGEFRYWIEKKDWDRALQIYESCDHQEKEDLLRMKIIPSGDTALHKLLRMTLKDEKKGNAAATFLNIKDSPATFQNKKEKAASLKKKKNLVTKLAEGLKFVKLEDLVDDRKNTPLHLAVAMEDHLELPDAMEVRQQICMEMALNQPDGISLRNKDGETPLFLAALYGSKDSFINLCEICCNNEPDSGLTKIYEYGTRSNDIKEDGSTVLHCAINEEYFDLALEIVRRFPEFVHRLDKREYSPLHLLATKTAAFKSSCPRTWLQDTIYRCLPEKILKWTKDPVRYYKSKTTNPEGVWKIVKCFLEPIVVILDMKEKHRKSIEIMNMLLSELQSHNYMNTAAGCKPKCDEVFELIRISNNSDFDSNQENKDSQVSSESSQKNQTEKETPIRLAAKNGIRELVEKILHLFPEAMYDTNREGKNVMHIALENRQIEVYKALTDWTLIKDLLHHNDENGNNALHHAATLGKYPPWRAPKAVLKMQYEIKWFESIKGPLPKNMLDHQNNKGKTPYQTFMETHEDLVKSDTDWLLKTTESCTLVAALIATVAFATSASLPGGINGYNGEPILQQERMFEVFAISSLVALCFSLTAVLMFLSILTSRHQAMDFHVYLPRKLLIGLTALFISIASMLVSFCGGHFFVLRKIVKQAQVVEYLVAFLPVMFFIIAQCPLYVKLFWATVIKDEP